MPLIPVQPYGISGGRRQPFFFYPQTLRAPLQLRFKTLSVNEAVTRLWGLSYRFFEEPTVTYSDLLLCDVLGKGLHKLRLSL